VKILLLYRLEQNNYNLERLPGRHLKSISWKEEDLQKLIYQNLEKLIQDEDLLLIGQSRNWQEEPDIMALDQNGDLYIFELKAWESKDHNLLQVLRYGQIFGQYSYEALNQYYLRHFPGDNRLLDIINNKYGVNLEEIQINKKQHFIIITNGLDLKTREAVLYWRTQGLDTQSWIYRLYEVKGDILLEFDTFEINENPYSDIEEGYYILNTNYSNNPYCDTEMIQKKKAAAYFDPWKRNITKLKKGNYVFLYRSGEGIIAYGISDGKLEKTSYKGQPDEEYKVGLNSFKLLGKPLPAKEIKNITGINHRFMSTMFGIDRESAKKVLGHIKSYNL
jgi:hypothetical protein